MLVVLRATGLKALGRKMKSGSDGAGFGAHAFRFGFRLVKGLGLVWGFRAGFLIATTRAMTVATAAVLFCFMVASVMHPVMLGSATIGGAPATAQF